MKGRWTLDLVKRPWTTPMRRGFQAMNSSPSVFPGLRRVLRLWRDRLPHRLQLGLRVEETDTNWALQLVEKVE